MEGMAASVIDDYRHIFVDNAHLLESDDFEHYVELAQQTNQSLEALLIEKAFISSNQFLKLSADYFHLPSTNLNISDVKRDALHYLAQDDALDMLVVPFEQTGHTLKVAVAHPHTTHLGNKIPENERFHVELYVTTEQAIRRALILYDQDIQQVLNRLPKPGEQRDDESLKGDDLALSIVEHAVLLEASDAHIEPYEDTVLIRFRIDGLLKQVASMPTYLLKPVVSFLKVQAALHTGQTPLPQEGQIGLSINGQDITVRLSIVPSMWGEKVVMHILPKEAHRYDLNTVGLLESDLAIIRRNLKRPSGMILVAGPTGSGKTTSLYAFLQEISAERVDTVNISTIEDPIEYAIPRVTQIQTDVEHKLTFASGLRAVLGQDPDIIMVGETGDKETAAIAVRSALAGRLLLSSLHTEDAVGAIPRLLDMGTEPYLVSSTLQLVMAQRLARKLCAFCRQSYEADESVRKQLGERHNLEQSIEMLQRQEVIQTTDAGKLRLFKAMGCDKCDHTGYNGRTGLYEVLELNDELRKNIGQHVDTTALRKVAIEQGMKTMFDDGLAKVTLGLIDLNELLRVVCD